MTRKNKRRGKASPKTSKDTGYNPETISRPMRLYEFQQTLAETTLAQTATVPAFFGGVTLTVLSPTFSLLDDAANLSTLFDQYRISRIHWTFRPMYTSENFVAPDIVPLIYTVCDFDDGAAPTTLAQLREYQGCQTHLTDSFTMSCVPHVANAVYSGAFTSYGNMTAPWIDIASQGVYHYGLKVAVTAGNVGQTTLQKWWVIVRLTYQCKNVR